MPKANSRQTHNLWAIPSTPSLPPVPQSTDVPETSDLPNTQESSITTDKQENLTEEKDEKKEDDESYSSDESEKSFDPSDDGYDTTDIPKTSELPSTQEFSTTTDKQENLTEEKDEKKEDDESYNSDESEKSFDLSDDGYDTDEGAAKLTSYGEIREQIKQAVTFEQVQRLGQEWNGFTTAIESGPIAYADQRIQNLEAQLGHEISAETKDFLKEVYIDQHPDFAFALSLVQGMGSVCDVVGSTVEKVLRTTGLTNK